MRNLLYPAALAAVLLAAVSSAAPAEDFVPSLPDFNETLPSKHYSGYLNATGGSFLHYYAVECIDRDPATAPVVLWLNGGPGCSSMDGWGYELGPFHFKNMGEPGPLFKLNPHTWARRVNLIFMEMPPGVGFSYREDGNYTISDTENAANNYAAVKFFFQHKFPEWASNTFYVAGESYGGVYVPTLAQQIFEGGVLTNFNGIIVGNGVTLDDADDFLQGDMVFDIGHGLCSEEVYEQTEEHCGLRKFEKNPGSFTDPKCIAAQNWYNNQTGFLNMYGYTYYCFDPPRPSWKFIPSIRRRLEWFAKAENNPLKRQLSLDEAMKVRAEFLHGPDAYTEGVDMKPHTAPKHHMDKMSAGVPPSPTGANVPCIDSSQMTIYLNREDVKAALHVKSELSWSICYYIDYKSNVPTTVPIWKQFIEAKLPVLFYSGNIDRSVPYTGTRYWIKQAGFTQTRNTTGWVFSDPDFIYGQQPGGLYDIYDDYFTFIRVNGAGHMVPQFRPAAAFYMFSQYMDYVERFPTRANKGETMVHRNNIFHLEEKKSEEKK